MPTTPTYPEPLTPRVISRTCIIVWMVLFILSLFTWLPFPFYLALAVLACVPVVTGPRWHRVAGVVLLAFSLWVAHGARQEDLRFAKRSLAIRARLSATNTPAAVPPSR